MEEKTVEELMQENGNPVTDKASAETDAALEQDPETAAAEADKETDPAGSEPASCEEGVPEEGASEEGASEEETEEESDETGEETASGEAAEGKKGFFNFKKGDKEKKALQEKVDALEDRVKRQMAEFENFRRRTEKEKQQMFSMGERNVIEKMLPIVDNFERGLAAVPEEEKEGALASGMEMVYRQLLKQLEDLGVTPIEAVGQEFDPSLHNAVMQVESEEYPSGTVAQELQKGYRYRDAVIRYSMVAVVQ